MKYTKAVTIVIQMKTSKAWKYFFKILATTDR